MNCSICFFLVFFSLYDFDFLMFFNLSLFAQDGPPWDFNGTDHGFVAQNYASLTVGDTYVSFTLNDADGDGDAESPNSNFRNFFKCWSK